MQTEPGRSSEPAHVCDGAERATTKDCYLRTMALLLAPFFMPLFLLGWLFPPEHERELDAEQAESERQFGETWAMLYAREGEGEEPAQGPQ